MNAYYHLNNLKIRKSPLFNLFLIYKVAWFHVRNRAFYAPDLCSSLKFMAALQYSFHLPLLAMASWLWWCSVQTHHGSRKVTGLSYFITFSWKLFLKCSCKIPHMLEVCQDIKPQKPWELWLIFLVGLSHEYLEVFYASSSKVLTM